MQYRLMVHEMSILRASVPFPITRSRHRRPGVRHLPRLRIILLHQREAASTAVARTIPLLHQEQFPPEALICRLQPLFPLHRAPVAAEPAPLTRTETIQGCHAHQHGSLSIYGRFNA